MTKLTHISVLILLIFQLAAITCRAAAHANNHLEGDKNCPQNYAKIFVSNSGHNSSSQFKAGLPVRTLDYARTIAHRFAENTAGFCILLKGGETFLPSIAIHLNVSSTPQQAESEDFNRAAFLWDLDKPLILSNYGTKAYPIIRSQQKYFAKDNGSDTNYKTIKTQIAIAVTAPSKQPVVIENIYLLEWEISAIWIYRTTNITIRNLIINKTGTLYFPEERYLLKEPNHLIYAAGVIYPKNSSNIKIYNNSIRNSHNRNDSYGLTGDLHVFYLSKVSDVNIFNNNVKWTSGPPIKIRHNSKNITIESNEFMYASPSKISDKHVEQQGFIRIPCKNLDTSCPMNVRIQNNKFHHPWCWGANCNNQKALRYSGQYFDEYSSRCSDRCWLSSNDGMASYCQTNCRGIQLLNNDFVLEWKQL